MSSTWSDSPYDAPVTDTLVALDRDIADLRVGLQTWTHLTFEQRARLLERVRESVASCAQEWAERAAEVWLRPGCR